MAYSLGEIAEFPNHFNSHVQRQATIPMKVGCRQATLQNYVPYYGTKLRITVNVEIPHICA